MHPAFLDSAPHRKSRQVLVGLRHEQLHKCNLHPHKNPTPFNYVDTQYLLLYKQGCYGPLPHDQASRDPRGVATGQARGTKYCYLSSIFKKPALRDGHCILLLVFIIMFEPSSLLV